MFAPSGRCLRLLTHVVSSRSTNPLPPPNFQQHSDGSRGRKLFWFNLPTVNPAFWGTAALSAGKELKMKPWACLQSILRGKGGMSSSAARSTDHRQSRHPAAELGLWTTADCIGTGWPELATALQVQPNWNIKTHFRFFYSIYKYFFSYWNIWTFRMRVWINNSSIR